MKKIILTVVLMLIAHGAHAYSLVKTEENQTCWMQTYKLHLAQIKPPMKPDQIVTFCIPKNSGSVSKSDSIKTADHLADMAENPSKYDRERDAWVRETNQAESEARRIDKLNAASEAQAKKFVNPDNSVQTSK